MTLVPPLTKVMGGAEPSGGTSLQWGCWTPLLATVSQQNPLVTSEREDVYCSLLLVWFGNECWAKYERVITSENVTLCRQRWVWVYMSMSVLLCTNCIFLSWFALLSITYYMNLLRWRNRTSSNAISLYPQYTPEPLHAINSTISFAAQNSSKTIYVSCFSPLPPPILPHTCNVHIALSITRIRFCNHRI